MNYSFKDLFAVLVFFIMTVGFTGCGSNKNNSSTVEQSGVKEEKWIIPGEKWWTPGWMAAIKDGLFVRRDFEGG